MPAGFDGLGAIKTANADKNRTNASFLTFTLLQDTTLYVAYNAKVSSFPSWLTASFTNTGEIIQTTNGPWRCGRKTCPPDGLPYQGTNIRHPKL